MDIYIYLFKVGGGEITKIKDASSSTSNGWMFMIFSVLFFLECKIPLQFSKTPNDIWIFFFSSIYSENGYHSEVLQVTTFLIGLKREPQNKRS